MSHPALAVAFGPGTASISEIVRAADGLAEPVFVLEDGPSAGRLRVLLEAVGPVLSLADGTDAVAARLAELRVAGIVTFRDTLQPVTAALAARLGLPYHTPECARLLTDKFAQRERLRSAGLPSPSAHLVTGPQDWQEALRRVPLPAVLKPVRGEGSRNTHRVDTAEAGAALVESLLGADPGAEPAESALVLEEYLIGRDEGPLGDYVSVEAAVVAGRAHVFAITGKFPLRPPFRETGHLWPARLSDEESAEITDHTRAALAALGVTTGVTHTEIKLTPAGPRIVEVNGRVGGLIPELALRASGLDVIGLALRLALGQDVEVEPARPDRVYFQYWMNAPAEARRFAGFDAAVARTLPGISGFRPYCAPGDLVGGGVATSPMGAVLGDAPDHDSAARTAAAALAGVSVRYLEPKESGRC